LDRLTISSRFPGIGGSFQTQFFTASIISMNLGVDLELVVVAANQVPVFAAAERSALGKYYQCFEDTGFTGAVRSDEDIQAGAGIQLELLEVTEICRGKLTDPDTGCCLFINNSQVRVMSGRKIVY
jgi:hypothetical protein